MIRNKDMEKIDRGLLPLNVIWAAMLVSLFIYLFVGLYIEDNLHVTTERATVATLRNILCAVSVITLFTTRSVRKLILYGKSGRAAVDANQSSYQGGQPSVLSKYTSATVVSLAMTESIGTCGLVLFIIGKNEVDLYSFVLISAATMLVYRPKRSEIISLTREFNKQGPL